MVKLRHLKEKALILRRQGKTLHEICDLLRVKKTTAYYWIKDIKIPITKSQKLQHIMAGMESQKRFKEIREKAYAEWDNISQEILNDPLNRDFIVMYMCEGYRKCRNSVAFVNSNPNMIKMAYRWITKNTSNKVQVVLRYYPDHDIEKLLCYWGKLLGIEKSSFKTFLKTSSGNLGGRSMVSEFGLITVRVGDTKLRAKMQALMDSLNKEWNNIN